MNRGSPYLLLTNLLGAERSSPRKESVRGDNPQQPLDLGRAQLANEKKYLSYSGPGIPSYGAGPHRGSTVQPQFHYQQFAKMEDKVIHWQGDDGGITIVRKKTVLSVQ